MKTTCYQNISIWIEILTFYYKLHQILHKLQNDKQSLTASIDFVTKIFLMTPFKTNPNDFITALFTEQASKP